MQGSIPFPPMEAGDQQELIGQVFTWSCGVSGEFSGLIVALNCEETPVATAAEFIESARLPVNRTALKAATARKLAVIFKVLFMAVSWVEVGSIGGLRFSVPLCSTTVPSSA